jgi:arylsulfatase A-like enzyme
LRFIGQCFVWLFPGPRTAVLAILLSTIEIVTLACHASGFWRNGGLSVATRLGLAGLILLSWTVIVWSGYWYFRVMWSATRRCATRWLRNIVVVIAIGPVDIGVNLYLACWLFYWRLGFFPDSEALYFAGLNANMLAKYFWQAERSAWISYLVVIALVTIACFLVVRGILRRFDRPDEQRKHVFLSQSFVLLAGVNAVCFSIDFDHFTRHSSQLPKDRAEVFKNPWAPYSFELRNHVNPTVTLLAGFGTNNDSKLTGEIPSNALTPLGKIRPANFPEIASENRRNIILITIESLRSDVVLMEHQEQQVMPHLAELARSGHFFPNCYANSTHSDYSDPCILSSLYPLRSTSTRRHYYRREDPWPKVLIYDLLKQYGYATAIFSSQNETWSNMHLFYESPNLDVFFDSRAFEGETSSVEAYFANWLSETGQIAGKLDDAVTVDHAIDWIVQQHKSQTPFFISMNLQTSHFPYERPDHKEEPFQPGIVVSGTSFIGYTEENVPVIRNAYYNALHYLDLQIGRLLKILQEMDLRERTIIVITGDHGEAFRENDTVGHAGKPLETVLKVGMLLNCPGLVEPGVDEYLAQAIDIVPTVLGRLGLPIHPAHQGIDLLSRERPAIDQRLVFVHCAILSTHTDAMISGTGWKYILSHARDYRELYYRPTDLEKHRNRISSEADVAALLHELMTEWRKRQLLYYQQSRYYGWFYPPRAPEPSEIALALWKRKSTPN